MAETEKDQRTEEATPHRKEKLREEGKVAKSPDVGSALVLAGAAGTLAAFGGTAAQDVLEMAERCFRLRDAHEPISALSATLPVLESAALPVVAASFVLAATAGVVQTKGLFSLSLLAFKPERLDPIPQLAQILPTKKTLVELAKQLLKIAAIGWVVYRVVADSISELVVLPASHAVVGASTVASLAAKVALHGGAALAVVAAFDWWLAHRKFEEDAKMSKQDVKDEHKEQEGRPEVKMRMRQRMRELVGTRAVGDVKDATVLVVNPTHFAVAMRYDMEKDPAPVVLAKGVDDVALEMRKEARKHGVPIIENRPLARALHRDAKVGKTIPAELYQAAAQVIAHVMQLRGVAPRRRGDA